MSLVKVPCKGCLKEKERNYSKQDNTGKNIYLDEFGKRWRGYSCYECHLKNCRVRSKIKSGASGLLITNCSFCNEEFKQKSSNQIFCSITCSRRQKWKNQKSLKPKVNCLFCHKELGHRLSKYCSSKCRFKYNYKPKVKSPKIIIQCVTCRKDFIALSNSRKFCSRRCFGQSRRKANKNKRSYKRKTKQVKACLICSISYKSSQPRSKYCSKGCLVKSGRANRRANKKMRKLKRNNRVPKWANIKAIEIIYRECPIGHDVDHIVPLNGKNVCGLHVEYNLQYLTKEDNNIKSNKFDGTYENLGWKGGT